jgi:hypothetical protein
MMSVFGRRRAPERSRSTAMTLPALQRISLRGCASRSLLKAAAFFRA